MKKIILFIFFIGIASAPLAQVQWGIKAGYNNTDLLVVSQYPNGYVSKSDFNAGILASIPLFSYFYFQPEIVYSGQGDKSDATENSTKLNLNYLNVPLLLSYHYSTGFYSQTGPQLGFLLSANNHFNGTAIDWKNSVENVDFSWSFGIGFQIPKMNLGFDARYNLGLSNIAKESFNGYTTARNSVFQFGLFYLFKAT